MMFYRIVTLLVPSLLSVAALSTQTTTQWESFSRRQIFTSSGAALGVLALLVSDARPVEAATTAPTADELNRIRVGYQQIQTLLDNFEEATTVCRENGGECKRDAEPIRK
jgi:hypothetical protein